MIHALPRPFTFRSQRVTMAAAIGLGVGFGIFQLQTSGFDGDAYWLAAQRLRDGLPLYVAGEAYDPLVYRYPPWFAWAWLPLTYLPHAPVMAVWRVAMMAAALSLIPALRHTYWGRVGLIVFVPMLLASGWWGNAQPLVVALAVYGMRRPVLLGLSAGLKLIPVALVAVYAQRRDWRGVGMVVAVAGLLIATMLVVDLSAYPSVRAPWPTDLALVLTLVGRRFTRPAESRDR